MPSHPLRVRGLKRGIGMSNDKRDKVAPFTGAWIETASPTARCPAGSCVAPFTGAWIETAIRLQVDFAGFGRTLYGCVD